MSGKILEAELRITGKDGTGAAFAGVLKRAEELKRALGGIQSMRIGGADFAAAEAAIKNSTSALRTQRIAAQELNRAFVAGNEALATRTNLITRMHQRWQGLATAGGMGWMFGGIASGRAARSIAHDATEFEHQRAMLSVSSGMKPEEVDRAVSQALALRIPTMSSADNLKAIGELRMVFGSTEHAINHLAAVQRAAGIMKAVNPNMDSESEAYNLARALELKGVSNDPEHFTRLANMMVQSVNASRGKITGSEFFQFTKYARAGAQRLSDDFYTRVAPTLIQELGGHSAGMALASFRQTLVGGKMTNKAAEEFVKLGLVDSHSVIRTKTGAVKGIRPGGLRGSDLVNEHPDLWISRYLEPALKKHGITDPNKIAEILAHLFSNRNSEQFANILLNQQQRIAKDRALIEEAPSSEALDALRSTDPRAAWSDMSSGITGLLAALGSPLVPPAIWAMNHLADGGRNLAEIYTRIARNNPILMGLASGAGGIGLGYVGFKGMQSMFGLVTGGTALKGSAVALDGAAAALNGAAARLAATGAVKDALGAAAPETRGMKWARRFGAFGPYVAPAALLAGGAYELATNDYHFDDKKRIKRNDALRESFNFERDRLGIPALGSGVDGHADITSKIVIEPSPDFLTRIETMIDNAISGVRLNGVSPAGSSGSDGHSMPEALPEYGP